MFVSLGDVLSYVCPPPDLPGSASPVSLPGRGGDDRWADGELRILVDGKYGVDVTAVTQVPNYGKRFFTSYFT